MTHWPSIFLACVILNQAQLEQPQRRTAFIERDGVQFLLAIPDTQLSEKDTLFLHIEIRNLRPKPIYLSNRFRIAEALVPDYDFHFTFDLGFGGYFDGDPLLTMTAPGFYEVSDTTSRVVPMPIPQILRGRDKVRPNRFMVNVRIAYLLNIDGLDNLLSDTSSWMKLESEGQLLLLEERVSELTVGPLGLFTPRDSLGVR